jgi:hypothetical protein
MGVGWFDVTHALFNNPISQYMLSRIRFDIYIYYVTTT